MGKKVEHPLDILREELQQTNVALKCAYDKFNYVTEPELIGGQSNHHGIDG